MLGQGGLIARAVLSAVARDTGSVGSLIKRGYQEGMTFSVDYDSRDARMEDRPKFEMPAVDFGGMGWVAIITAALAVILVILAQYGCKVIMTLAIVEEPPAIYLPLESENPIGSKPAAILGLNAPKTYITNSIRGTGRHLVAEAGRFSHWRGWNANIVYAFTLGTLDEVLKSTFMCFLPKDIARPLAGVLSYMLLTRFAMACTHIIISKSQPTNWLKRTLATPWSTARHTLPAMAHMAFVSILGEELLHYGMHSNLPCAAKSVLLAASLFVSILVTLPFMVALIRVQASVLPDNQEGIVPFDRSFGVTDGMTALSFGQAMKSVGCAGWKRIMKLGAKCVGVVLGFVFLASLLISAQLFMFVKFTNLESILAQIESESY